MKQIRCSKKRWERFRNALLQLSKGDLSTTLFLEGHDDDLEDLELIINLIQEEWSTRVLHLAFTKPSQFQKIFHHFKILLTPTYLIKDVDERFITYFKSSKKHLQHQSIFKFLDEDSAVYLKKIKTKKKPLKNIYPFSLQIFGQTHLFGLTRCSFQHLIILDLYQVRIPSHLVQLLATANPLDDSEKLKQLKQRQLIEKIKNYIDSLDPKTPLKIKDLCTDFGINVSHLERDFKALYQQTVYNYYISIRMERALQLIGTEELSLKEVAAFVGYDYYTNFSATFYKFYHKRPSELRKELLKKQQNN